MIPNVDLELDLQYEATQPDLHSEQIQSWVQTALNEAVAVYTEQDLTAPFTKAVLVVRFCDAEESRRLNAQYRQKDYATNVLTFEYGIDEHNTLSGDIIICTEVLEKEAQEQGKAFTHHAAHLCVHGVLHALGYDHIATDEAEEMEALEIDILHLLHIPNPYV